MRYKITLLILSVFILTIQSCGIIEGIKDPEPNPSIQISLSHIGYNHVDFNAEFTDIVDYSNFKEFTVYYDQVNSITPNSASQTKYYDNDNLNFALGGLEMGESYFVQILHGQANSNTVYVTTKTTTFDCSITEGFIQGDNSYSRQYETVAPGIGGPTRLREFDSGNGVMGNLEGEFTHIRMEIPVPAIFYSGIYTTYNSDSQGNITLSTNSASITLTDDAGNTFKAVADQAFKFTDENFGFNVTFCDVVFINDSGQIITLSANLEGV
jgi:hypothetical protein